MAYEQDGGPLAPRAELDGQMAIEGLEAPEQLILQPVGSLAVNQNVEIS